MGNLKHITFTGVDEKTNLRTLQHIQNVYPKAEFGVLTSYHWYENGNRYMDPMLIKNLRGTRLHLALHLCGSAAHDATNGFWSDINHLLYGNLDIFPRVQLNVATRKDNPEYIIHNTNKEIIVQAKGIGDTKLFDSTRSWYPESKCSILLDGSGGRGIDTGIEVLNNHEKVGYAGGINPDNVKEKLEYLLENVDGDFWIDMESGVRTGDWFDVEKVIAVLKICDQVLNNPKENKAI